MRVAINGFGRIGRSIFRVITSRAPHIEIVAINDLATDEMEAYLLEYDTVMGRFPGKVEVVDSHLVAGGQRVRLLTEKDPAVLPWAALGVDVVIESTGAFRDREKVGKHLEAGAKRVILTVPAKDALDATIVLGVNDAALTADVRMISNASCTTNCLAPVAKVIDETFGIRRGVMTTVHAYTNDQRLADVPHKDLRRSRAATENIIPTSTGAAQAVAEVLPHLIGKLDGMAMRVPVPDGSTVDLVVELERPTTVEAVNAAIRTAAAGPMAGIIEYTEAPIVSSDVIGNPHSSVFDAACTRMLGDRTLKVLAWYDNEWGYSNRVVDLIERIAGLPA